MNGQSNLGVARINIYIYISIANSNALKSFPCPYSEGSDTNDVKEMSGNIVNLSTGLFYCMLS